MEDTEVLPLFERLIEEQEADRELDIFHVDWSVLKA